MQAPNNNQGPRPPYPVNSQSSSQFRPQNGQMPISKSYPAASPFSNPPASSNGTQSPKIFENSSLTHGMSSIRPPTSISRSPNPQAVYSQFSQSTAQEVKSPELSSGSQSRPSGPLMQQNTMIRPQIPARPFNAPVVRPSASDSIPRTQNQSNFVNSSVHNAPRIPVQESPTFNRPMSSENQSASLNISNTPVPNSQVMPNINRPPMLISLNGPNMNRPPMPNLQNGSNMNRPPMLNSHVAPNMNRPPMSYMQNGSNINRPPIPNSQNGPNMNRPPMPSSQVAPNMIRPPMAISQNGLNMNRPPMPSSQNGSNMNRPPMPISPVASNINRPPMPSSQNGPNMNRPPMSNFMSPVPSNVHPQQQTAPVSMLPSIPQASGFQSPSMRYPAGPGYSQQPTQMPAYPQTMPPTQQGASQFQNQNYVGGQMAAPFQQPAPPKVNPAAIPSVVAVLEADELRFKESGQPFMTYSSIVENAPPLPTTRSVSIIDDGNSSPQFIRSTMSHIPISEEICENSKIPLSLLIQPFASNPQSEVPLVDFGASGPIRCNRCRAYINPHAQFIKGGRYYVCHLCEMSNEVSEEYYANLDMSGKRIDLDIRPELKFGTVDFVASKEYLNKPAGKPHLLFVLDTSRAAVGSGAFQTSLESIKAFVSNPNAIKYYGGMAILTHDRSLTFYTLQEGRNEPQVLVMGDVYDPFVPLHANDLYFDPVKCSAGLSVLLTHLSTSITIESRPVDSSFGAAVTVALESLKVRGGRAVFFQTTLPSYGPGTLVNRESSVTGSSSIPKDKANPLLFPQGDFYSKLAIQAAEQGISISLVFTPAAHIDLASLGVLAKYSSGTVLHYPRFTAQQHINRVVGDVISLLSTSFAFDCLARIRCNSGIQVKKHYGHFYAASNGHDLSFGTLSSEQSFAALLEYDGKLSEKDRVCFQVAFLHTDAFSGQRRIRVLNLALPCTSSIQTIFRMAELDSIISFYLKKNVSQILEAPAAAFPASFTAKCVNILAAYRKYCAANMSSGQLILPDSLKLFPVITLAIHKDPAFNIAPISIDLRWHAIHRLADLSLPLTITHFYPQLFPLASVLDHGEILPACIRLSREHLTKDGIYLLNNGTTLTLYVGDSVDPNVLKDIFGVTQLNAVNLSSSSNSSLPIFQNARSAKIRQILTVIRSQHSPHNLTLRLIRQSVDIAEDAEFAAQLIEDASSLAASYVDFLCRVHSQIQHTISQGYSLSLAERTSMLSFLQ